MEGGEDGNGVEGSGSVDFTCFSSSVFETVRLSLYMYVSACVYILHVYTCACTVHLSADCHWNPYHLPSPSSRKGLSTIPDSIRECQDLIHLDISANSLGR